jgi:ribosomal protein S18 acetylase RimI-like enzyme
MPLAQQTAITLRPETDSDRPLLFELYASTRAEELAMTGWSAEEQQRFLEIQFRAQYSGYRATFPNAQFEIVLVDEAPVGRMVVDRSAEEIRLVDLVITPEHRNQGIGTKLTLQLVQESAASGRALRLNVLTGNRAARLYERLGFIVRESHGLYTELEWRLRRAAVSTPATVRLPLSYNAAALQADAAQFLNEEFIPHFNRAYYEGDWSVVPLRSIGGRPDQIYPDPTATRAYADTPLLDRCPAVREVLGTLQCEFQAVRFLRLKSGSVIKEHRDFQLELEDGEVRLHVPVFTNPDVEFILNGNRVLMNPGELWYCNFNLPHSVANRGATDRIHLVMDCFMNDWLRNLILSSAKHQ